MTIPKGTRQLHDLRDVAGRLGLSHHTIKHWWKRGVLLGRVTAGQTRKRVMVPIEVVEFYLRHHRQPTKLELYRSGVLSREYLLELSGPDGGLRELENHVGAAGPAAPSTDSGTFLSAAVS